MNLQVPDRWVILKITNQSQEFKSILAGWHGGYLGSDEWRRSSPIANLEEDEEEYTATTESGTVYRLKKGCEGFNSIMTQIYDRMLSMTDETIKLEIIKMGVDNEN